METYSLFIDSLNGSLKTAEYSESPGGGGSLSRGLADWEERSLALKAAGGALFFIGNGASAALASHFAVDCGKNAGFKTQVFTDAALITALANDLAFEDVFAEPLKRCAHPGDMLVAVSSSGNSPNIIKAALAAREMGLCVVTLSGFSPDNRLRALGDLNFWVPAETYGLAETAHAALLHYWVDRLTAQCGKKRL